MNLDKEQKNKKYFRLCGYSASGEQLLVLRGIAGAINTHAQLFLAGPVVLRHNDKSNGSVKIKEHSYILSCFY